ncbi:MAG: UDP-N-acetylglucosamine 2-epimerase (non-hydrolyzing) [Selenomonadales bacterium]|nr:UDP-N-acetylglucosamine 2-epimerase (non-hydrolyzing) [Selenomonadales bacterium]
MAIKVFTVFGVRPEAVKMAPVISELGRYPEFSVSVCVTGQHRAMLDQVLRLFSIEPKYDLNIMRERQTLPETFARALTGLDEIFRADRPDIVLVHGDTSTTLAGSLAAFYNQVPVGHVEAGLRTHEKYLPFPEEINRKLTGSLADLHFAPTPTAKGNLLREGVREESIFITGNTVIDALATTVRPDYEYHDAALRQALAKTTGRLLLVEVHRRENWGEPMQAMCLALLDVLAAFPDCRMIFPVHLNPVVREVVMPHLAGHPQITLLDPLDTDDFHNLMARSYLILTDSGGLQEEAPALGVPVLVMRTSTERPEAVEAGTVRIVGTSRAGIVAHASELLESKAAYQSMSTAINPYGDGRAAGRIAQALLHFFGRTPERPAEWRGAQCSVPSAQ